MRGGSRPEKLGTLFFRVGLPGKTSVAGGETSFSVRGFLEGDFRKNFGPISWSLVGRFFRLTQAEKPHSLSGESQNGSKKNGSAGIWLSEKHHDTFFRDKFVEWVGKSLFNSFSEPAGIYRSLLSYIKNTTKLK